MQNQNEFENLRTNTLHLLALRLLKCEPEICVYSDGVMEQRIKQAKVDVKHEIANMILELLSKDTRDIDYEKSLG